MHACMHAYNTSTWSLVSIIVYHLSRTGVSMVFPETSKHHLIYLSSDLLSSYVQLDVREPSIQVTVR